LSGIPDAGTVISNVCQSISYSAKCIQGGLSLVTPHPLLFLLYVNDLPKITDENSKLILFADDTSVIIISPNPTNFENNVNKIFHDINRWFNTNLLSLNLDQTHFMQLVTKNSSVIDLKLYMEVTI
jgi:hypothetical protein